MAATRTSPVVDDFFAAAQSTAEITAECGNYEMWQLGSGAVSKHGRAVRLTTAAPAEGTRPQQWRRHLARGRRRCWRTARIDIVAQPPLNNENHDLVEVVKGIDDQFREAGWLTAKPDRRACRDATLTRRRLAWRPRRPPGTRADSEGNTTCCNPASFRGTAVSLGRASRLSRQLTDLEPRLSVKRRPPGSWGAEAGTDMKLPDSARH